MATRCKPLLDSDWPAITRLETQPNSTEGDKSRKNIFDESRWIGATGSDFCIKRDPAKVLGGAVARSTPPLGHMKPLLSSTL